MTKPNCSCYDFSDVEIDVDEWNDYTGTDEWNAIYTVQIGELVAAGVFDWENPLLDWSSAALDENQYKRICSYFMERFYYREISLEPFEEWARIFHRKMVFEVMPKYKPLYARIAEGVNPLAGENEYYKSRAIESAYPETLLSQNADYITDGRDVEEQRIKEKDFVEQNAKFAELYKGVDEMLLDEFECLFISLYTMNVNATW